jgi:hypothetical protein
MAQQGGGEGEFFVAVEAVSPALPKANSTPSTGDPPKTRLRFGHVRRVPQRSRPVVAARGPK